MYPDYTREQAEHLIAQGLAKKTFMRCTSLRFVNQLTAEHCVEYFDLADVIRVNLVKA